MTPMAAALTGALIAGVGMYAIGARAQDQFAMNPALPGNVPISYFASPQPVAQQPVAYAPVYAPAPQQAVYRRVEYWVEKGTYYPIKGKFYSDSGRVLKIIYFRDFSQSLGAVRPRATSSAA